MTPGMTSSSTAGGGSALTSEEAAVYSELKGLMHEVLLLLGLFALCCPRNAEALRWRWSGHPTMLHRLCELPFGYYCDPRLRAVVLPTLLCACLHDSVNLRILTSRLSPQHLLNFLKINAQPTASQSTPLALGGEDGAAAPPPTAYTPPAALIDDPSELPIVNMEYALAARLPPELWQEAAAFFASRPESPVPDLLGARGEEPPIAARDSELSG